MRKRSKLLGCLWVSALLFMFSCSGKSGQTMVHVDLQRVFNEFELKKELSAKLENELSKRKTNLDSVEYTLQSLQRNFSGGEQAFYQKYKDKVELYGYLKNKYEQEASNLTSTYDEQIWKRIRGYVKEYGEEHKVDMVLGQKNEGTLLYANPAIDRTDELIEYINKKYKGE